MAYWILKTEPTAYSFNQLLHDGETRWDGVRNYQARNNLKQMQKGDICFIYHSMSSKEIVGVAKVAHEAYTDPTTTDSQWVCVDIQAIGLCKKPISLHAIKEHPILQKMVMVKQSRLSVIPVTKKEASLLLAMSQAVCPTAF